MVCLHHSMFNHPPAERDNFMPFTKNVINHGVQVFVGTLFSMGKKNVLESDGWFVICGKWSGELLGSSKELSVMFLCLYHRNVSHKPPPLCLKSKEMRSGAWILYQLRSVHTEKYTVNTKCLEFFCFILSFSPANSLWVTWLCWHRKFTKKMPYI